MHLCRCDAENKNQIPCMFLLLVNKQLIIYSPKLSILYEYGNGLLRGRPFDKFVFILKLPNEIFA